MKNGPKNLKFKTMFKGKIKKFKFKNSLKFGLVGLKSLQNGTLNFQQIESARKTIIKKTKRKVKIWIQPFLFLPVTKKPIGIRMGKGKGKFSHWITKISQGSLIFEICGSNKKLLILSLLICKSKLPIKTKICLK